MTFSPNEVRTEAGPTVCAVHPTVETTLRCNKCGRYMCARCSVLTPVGYRCKQCVHQQQDVYFTATPVDYVVAGAVSFVLGLPAAFILTRPQMGLFLAIILSLPAGSLIAEVVYRATGRRRGRYTWMIVAAGIVAGAIATNFPLIQQTVRRGVINPLGLGIPLVFVVLCAAGAVARLRYGK
jgi:hypothetical protein